MVSFFHHKPGFGLGTKLRVVLFIMNLLSIVCVTQLYPFELNLLRKKLQLYELSLTPVERNSDLNLDHSVIITEANLRMCTLLTVQSSKI